MNQAPSLDWGVAGASGTLYVLDWIWGVSGISGTLYILDLETKNKKSKLTGTFVYVEEKIRTFL